MDEAMAVAISRFDLLYLGGAILFVAVTGMGVSRFLMRMLHEPRERRRQWQTLVGATVGVMSWCCCMLVTLSHRWLDADGAEIPVGFDMAPLAIGLVFTLVLCTAVFNLGIEGERNLAQSFAMGAGSGAGTLFIYWQCLNAMNGPGNFSMDPTYWRPALVMGIGVFGLGSTLLHAPLRWRRQIPGAILIQIALIGTMILGALSPRFMPDPTITVPDGLVDRGSLTYMVVAIAALSAAVTLLFSRIDLTSARAAEERFRHLALHDPLTGLPNRAMLGQELEQALAAIKAGRESRGAAFSARDATLALIGVDLDRFKPVNDVQGHAAGDAVLAGIGRRVQAVLGPGELFARTGGDEFVALKVPCTRDEAAQFARRLHDAIVAPVEWECASLSVGGSLGIALHPQDGRDAGALMTRVDLALYRAKKEAAGEIVFYDRRMDEASRDRSALAMELRQALANDQFELHYQPQTRLGDGAITGYEALIRWRHPTRGMVAPDDFIPVAEHTGLIREIGAWVLHAACREAAEWTRRLPVSVNVSPAQLSQSDFIELVRDALLTSGLDPTRLELEVTEASMIADHEQLRSIMRALKALGVRVAMDDYGAGYASLAALRSFPFDKIKIDRGFIESLGHDPQSIAIVRSTLLLGKALSIPVLAEGVCSEEGLRILREEGCAEGQGFLFGRPMEGAEIRRRMSDPQEGEGPSDLAPDAPAGDAPTAARPQARDLDDALTRQVRQAAAELAARPDPDAPGSARDGEGGEQGFAPEGHEDHGDDASPRAQGDEAHPDPGTQTEASASQDPDAPPRPASDESGESQPSPHSGPRGDGGTGAQRRMVG